MEPKLKALELVNKFEKILKLDYENYYKYDFGHCRKCALIAVDEILNIDNVKPYILHKEIINYYTKVKEEIEKL